MLYASSMLLRQIYDEDLAQAAWLLGCQKTGEAIVIDPERDIDRYLDSAESHGMRITAVAETHIHEDFLSGARELADRTGAHVYVSGMGGEDWRSRWLDPHPHAVRVQVHPRIQYQILNPTVPAAEE